MSKDLKQAEALKTAHKTIREQTIEIETRHRQILALAGIISDQKLLIKKLHKPTLWEQLINKLKS